MQIVVLLKQVPSTESMVRIAEDGVSIRTDEVKWVINPYDEIAVEEALRIKSDQGGTVTVLSVGNSKTVEAIRTALAMGADKGVLVDDPGARGCDALGTAKILAKAVESMGYDLIIAGQRAVDDDNYQVGPAVAEFLSLVHIPLVMEQEISDGTIRCRCTVDGGSRKVEAPLPALITTQRGLNEPRYASLPGIMKAKKKPLETLNLADIGLTAESLSTPKSRIVAMRFPPERSGGRIIEGASAQEKAAELVRLLHEEAKVI